MSKMNIALLAGGDSGEYDISIKSANEIRHQLASDGKYNIFLIHVRNNEWSYSSPEGVKILVDKNDFSLPLGPKKVFFDLAFIAIHGTPGEDGKLQGYFEMQRIPVSTCNSFTASLTFNKYFTINVVRSLGVLCAHGMLLHWNQPFDPKEILHTTGLPCFVKPNKGGSSVGMSKVTELSDLREAVSGAFAEDDEVLVEQFIRGREITCGVYRENGKLRVLPLTEIVSKKEFFDYEAKYNPALADEIVPAPLKLDLEVRIKETSALLYQQLNCKGIVRFDYIVADHQIWFLEVNTVPGMTAESIVPKMVKCMGTPMTDFYDALIAEAMQKAR
ncbi:MAG: D-alanine--D-alanine ligase [Bacteroidia bacterium]|nr:D-alanine--D-alanine ligase [Bacteroidia bacterium]